MLNFYLFKCISLFLFCFLGEKNTSFINVLHICGSLHKTVKTPAFSFVTFGLWVPCNHIFPTQGSFLRNFFQQSYILFPIFSLLIYVNLFCTVWSRGLPFPPVGWPVASVLAPWSEMPLLSHTKLLHFSLLVTACRKAVGFICWLCPQPVICVSCVLGRGPVCR